MLLKMGRFLETPDRQTPILQTRLISIGNKTDTVSIYPPATHPRYATGRAGRYRPALRPEKGSRPPARGAPPKRDLPREQGLPDPRPSYPSAGGITRPGAVSPPARQKEGERPAAGTTGGQPPQTSSVACLPTGQSPRCTRAADVVPTNPRPTELTGYQTGSTRAAGENTTSRFFCNVTATGAGIS